mmetsp:Transcript_11431/g.32382  ORF Transcript_11431/g.32382 Transcript_11431/m.32382 type:complete len:377 (-) Transcript_11431:2093-3223(-)
MFLSAGAECARHCNKLIAVIGDFGTDKNIINGTSLNRRCRKVVEAIGFDGLINGYHRTSFRFTILYSDALGAELGHLKAISDAYAYGLPDKDGLLSNRQEAEFIFRNWPEDVVATNLLQILVSIHCLNTRNRCRRSHIDVHQFNITLRCQDKVTMKSRRRYWNIVDVERFSSAMKRSRCVRFGLADLIFVGCKLRDRFLGRSRIFVAPLKAGCHLGRWILLDPANTRLRTAYERDGPAFLYISNNRRRWKRNLRSFNVGFELSDTVQIKLIQVRRSQCSAIFDLTSRNILWKIELVNENLRHIGSECISDERLANQCLCRLTCHDGGRRHPAESHRCLFDHIAIALRSNQHSHSRRYNRYVIFTTSSLLEGGDKFQ